MNDEEEESLQKELEELRSTKMTEEQFQRFLKIIAKAGVVNPNLSDTINATEFTYE